MSIVVNVEIDWGKEIIKEIYSILQKHVEITKKEYGCEELTFSIDVNNPNIIRATELWTNMNVLEDHFKTKYWEYFNSIMEKYPPKNIIVNTYDVEKIKHPLD